MKPTKPELDSLTATNDLITSYMNYADIFESPTEAHSAVMQTLISAVVNGDVWINNGGQKVTMDFWTLLLSGSGVGRNTLLSLLDDVLKEAGLEQLVRNTTWGSRQAFYQELAENPRAFFVWEEVSASLKALSDARFGEAKQWLTNVYDSLKIPAAITYRRANPNRNTPPIEFNSPPRISILASSSHEWFTNSLTEADSIGGFIPRWFLVDLPDSDRCIPTPRKPDERLVPHICGLPKKCSEPKRGD